MSCSSLSVVSDFGNSDLLHFFLDFALNSTNFRVVMLLMRMAVLGGGGGFRR